MANNSIADALAEGRQNDTLKETLATLAQEELTSAQDAQTVVEFLAHEQDWLLSGQPSPSRLYPVLGLFHQVGSQEAYRVLNEHGLPILREIHDAWAAITPWDARRNDDFMFLIKLFAMYANEQDIHRVANAARSPETSDEYLWAPIFANLDPQNPYTEILLDSLAQPLPQGFAAICYLDASNARARESNAPHPFNSPEGHDLLESYLRDSDPNFNSYAHSAAAALPFQDNPRRGQLLALALDHADERVQLEAAWASARLGSRAGIEFLSRACLDWRQSSVAVEYLTELGELNAIPSRAKDPNFMAISEMARWLAHPMEFGRAPDDLTLVDSRQLFWPPANEERQLWILRYRYDNEDPNTPADTGVGLVGNITFALFGETTPEMSPEDIYALHCCWELEVEENPLAPAERTIPEGHRLLREAGNPGF